MFFMNMVVICQLADDCLPNTVNFPKSEFFIRMESISATAIKSRGEMGQHCLIPLSIENLGDIPCGNITVLFVSL